MAATSFDNIRIWRASQDQAFEELCYQLRDPTPDGAELIKTGNPDGGLEWYFKFPDGELWGWQAKFISDRDTLLGEMKKSLKTVIDKRPTCSKLTFCIKTDLSDAPGRSGREKFEAAKAKWTDEIEGAKNVTIELLSEGDLLDRLNSHKSQRGIEWFFWRDEVFDTEWSKSHLKRVAREVGPRYNPHLNVELPIENALEGLARSETFHEVFKVARGRVVRACSKFEANRFEKLERQAELDALVSSAEAWISGVPPRLEAWELPDSSSWIDLSNAMFEMLTAAAPDSSPPDHREELTEEERAIQNLADDLKRAIARIEDALGAFAAFARSEPTLAAEHRSLFILGEGGQGKTHLICDVASRRCGEGQPVAVILGNRCSGHAVWEEVARQLGVGNIGSEALIQGMRAAAEASDKPFLLLFDALNESDEPFAWQNELPAVLAELADSPWIAVGFTVRSEYEDVALPPRDELKPTPIIVHPGFAGREVEAAEKFFEFYGIVDAQVPELDPAFANPLFLRMYCEGLQVEGATAPPAGSDSVNAVFDRYVAKVSRAIDKKLKLDKHDRTVARGIDALAKEMIVRQTDSIPYDDGKAILNSFAPNDRTEWPETVTGQMLAEGLLSRDLRWNEEVNDYVERIRFTFQRFADFRIADALLDGIGSRDELAKALGEEEGRAKQIESARAGWVEALSVVVPERYGVELLAVHNWGFGHREFVWQRAFLNSLVARLPAAVSDESVQLFESVQGTTQGNFRQALDTIITVAAKPDHPLNADRLHQSLLNMTMPKRDVVWSIETYYDLDEEVPLGRLVRWAARNHEEVDSEVVRLAAIPLIWTFTSPNRRLRDYATKSLSKLLSNHVPVATQLVESFEKVDDPYVVERLAVSAHGALLQARPFSEKDARALLEAMERLVLGASQVPNLVSRDAVRGCAEVCNIHGAIDDNQFERFKPPYATEPPNEPPSKEELEKKYDRDRRDPKTGERVQSPYGTIFSSTMGYGDFGRYVLQSKVRYFSELPLSEPRPEKFELDAPESQFSYEFAERWVIDRVMDLGWDPNLFDSFDRSVGYHSFDRSGHKPERFGKKYQWIALRELIARIADNFHMSDSYYGASPTYEGAWQFGRDIDPTLPPAERRRNDDDEFVLGETFASDRNEECWWVPPLPVFAADEMPVAEDWATTDDEYPEMKDLVVRAEPGGDRWIVLQAYFNSDEEIPEDNDRFESPRRDFWSHIVTWIVGRVDRDDLVAWLESRSHVGGELSRAPERIDAAYLGELPWSDSLEFSMDWEPMDEFGSPDIPECKVLHTRLGYLWEGGIGDCSIEDSVHAMLPASLIYQLAGLDWIPGSRCWAAQDYGIVAQFRESADTSNSALIVRESWLKSLLELNDLSLVVAWVGEKQLVAGGITGGLIGDWTLIDAVASFTEGEWVFGDRRLEIRKQAG